jgi:hypothetical protein
VEAGLSLERSVSIDQSTRLVGVKSLATWGCEFESRRKHGWLSLVSAVCCQVEVSASDLSLVQRSPAECGVSNKCDCDAPLAWTMNRNMVESHRKKK